MKMFPKYNVEAELCRHGEAANEKIFELCIMHNTFGSKSDKIKTYGSLQSCKTKNKNAERKKR